MRRQVWHMDVLFTDRRMEWQTLVKHCNTQDAGLSGDLPSGELLSGHPQDCTP
jgi:hypothetical protein